MLVPPGSILNIEPKDVRFEYLNVCYFDTALNSLVTPYDDINLDQPWLRKWPIAWLQPSQFLNQYLLISSMGFCGAYLKLHMKCSTYQSITRLKITHAKLPVYLLGANQLIPARYNSLTCNKDRNVKIIYIMHEATNIYWDINCEWNKSCNGISTWQIKSALGLWSHSKILSF